MIQNCTNNKKQDIVTEDIKKETIILVDTKKIDEKVCKTMATALVRLINNCKDKFENLQNYSNAPTFRVVMSQEKILKTIAKSVVELINKCTSSNLVSRDEIKNENLEYADSEKYINAEIWPKVEKSLGKLTKANNFSLNENKNVLKDVTPIKNSNISKVSEISSAKDKDFSFKLSYKNIKKTKNKSGNKKEPQFEINLKDIPLKKNIDASKLNKNETKNVKFEKIFEKNKNLRSQSFDSYIKQAVEPSALPSEDIKKIMDDL